MSIYFLLIAVVLKSGSGHGGIELVGAYATKKECENARSLEERLRPSDKKALRGSACVKVN